MRFLSNLPDDAPNPVPDAERPIDGCTFQLLHYPSLGWTHSLSRFGADPFATADAALADFWATKARLPDMVHRYLFGSIATLPEQR